MEVTSWEVYSRRYVIRLSVFISNAVNNSIHVRADTYLRVSGVAKNGTAPYLPCK